MTMTGLGFHRASLWGEKILLELHNKQKFVDYLEIFTPWRKLKEKIRDEAAGQE